MRKLTANVNIDGVWYGPAYPDVEVPAEAAAQIGDHAWDSPAQDTEPEDDDQTSDPQVEQVEQVDEVEEHVDEDHDQIDDQVDNDDELDPTGDDELDPPPLVGPGSTSAAWAHYARALGIDVPEDAGRGQIVMALKRAGKNVAAGDEDDEG